MRKVQVLRGDGTKLELPSHQYIWHDGDEVMASSVDSSQRFLGALATSGPTPAGCFGTGLDVDDVKAGWNKTSSRGWQGHTRSPGPSTAWSAAFIGFEQLCTAGSGSVQWSPGGSATGWRG